MRCYRNMLGIGWQKKRQMKPSYRDWTGHEQRGIIRRRKLLLFQVFGHYLCRIIAWHARWSTGRDGIAGFSRRCTTERKITKDMDRQHHRMDWTDTIYVTLFDCHKFVQHRAGLCLASTVIEQGTRTMLPRLWDDHAGDLSPPFHRCKRRRQGHKPPAKKTGNNFRAIII